MNRLVLLLTPLVVVAAFVSLFSKGESKPPPRIARLALAVALYSALTAIEWFFCLKDNGYLIVEWKDFVLWPFFDLPDFVRSVGTPLSSGSGWRLFRIAADLATVVPCVTYPARGDFLVDGKWLFEVGGPGKTFGQIADVPESYLVVDDLEIGRGNRIPLWMFGLLY